MALSFMVSNFSSQNFLDMRFLLRVIFFGIS